MEKDCLKDMKDKVTIREVYQLLSEVRLEIKSSALDTNKRIDDMQKSISENYVSKVEFWPVRAIVYGGAGIVLVGVLGTILYLIGLKG